MTVKELAEKFGYEIISMPEPDRIVEGGYTGDLLSWVMGRLTEGSAWVTIMSNVNIIAVATLADPACIILSEGVVPDEGVAERARTQGVNLFRTEKTSFDACGDVMSVL